MTLFTCHAQRAATACFVSVASGKRVLLCGLLTGDSALGGAHALAMPG